MNQLKSRNPFLELKFQTLTWSVRMVYQMLILLNHVQHPRHISLGTQEG